MTRETATPGTRHRDVVVWTVADIGYTLTHSLRAAGLSVASWMQPSIASTDRVMEQLARDLVHRKLPAPWADAPVVVTMWPGREMAAAVAPTLRHLHAAAACHVDLTPYGSLYGTPRVLPEDDTHTTVLAPTLLDWVAEEIYLGGGGPEALHARATIAAQAEPNSRTEAVARALTALATLPDSPPALRMPGGELVSSRT